MVISSCQLKQRTLPDPTNPNCRNNDFSQEIRLLYCSRKPEKITSTITTFLETFELPETQAQAVRQAISDRNTFFQHQIARVLEMANVGEDCCSLDIQSGAECVFFLLSHLEKTLTRFGDALASVVCQVGYMPPPKAFILCSDPDAKLTFIRGQDLSFTTDVKTLKVPPAATEVPPEAVESHDNNDGSDDTVKFEETE